MAEVKSGGIMKTYSDLKPNEKELFNTIESIFINHRSIDQQSFVKILGILINKYKFCGKKNAENKKDKEKI